MKMSEAFGATLRDNPSNTDSVGHSFLLRAGFVRQIGQGLFAYLPMGWKVLRRIEKIIRDEMDAAGGIELSMPLVQPAELWRKSGRWDSVGPELLRLNDRRHRDLVLAMTNEEAVASLAASEIRSWRDLPKLVYQIQLKFRDDPRPRAGLIRTREFTMKDAYSFDADSNGLNEQYQRLYDAYLEIFRRCGIPAVAVGGDLGIMGGTSAHEFMYLDPIGEDTLVLCGNCGYAQNRQVASMKKPEPAFEERLPLEMIATPNSSTIDSLANQLGVLTSRTGKVVFFSASTNDKLELPVVAVVRGDMTVNESKLAALIGATDLRPALEDEILAIGAVPGYGSPIGLNSTAYVVVDDLVASSRNLLMGANVDGFHYQNANINRDYQAARIGDIVSADEGDLCPNCDSTLRTERGVEIGNIFKLGTKFSSALGANYQDSNGDECPITMGSYGIGVGRLMGCLAEHYHDAAGLLWPVDVSPFKVHLCSIGSDVFGTAGSIYRELEQAGIETLWDDRDLRPGIQFSDADLIGVPIRLTVSSRSLSAGGIETKLRGSDVTEIVTIENSTDWVSKKISELRSSNLDV
ncbi:MAG: proline--tRNA ligase [Acidimicrobiales bacterium]